MTHTTPLISVIMPAYNRERSVSESVQSIIDQHYDNWELLVVDDRSKDRTKDIIQSYVAVDDRIKYLKNEFSQGPAGARNFGIDHAQGEYLAFLDSDDLWLPNHLSDSINVLEKEHLNFCSAKWYEKKGDVVKPSAFVGCIDYLMKTFPSRKRDSNAYVFDSSICEYLFVRDFYPFHISTVVIKKTTLTAIGKFDEKLFGPEDSDMLFRIILKHGMCIINSYHSLWVEGDDNIHFFREEASNFESKTMPSILRNRLNHVKLFKKQIRFIQKNRHLFSDYQLLKNLKTYEVAFNCRCLSRLLKSRNYPLYLKMRWNAFVYYHLTSREIQKMKTNEWPNLLRPRVLFERLPKMDLSTLKTESTYRRTYDSVALAKRTNFWLYFEKDVQLEQAGATWVLINRRTREGISLATFPVQIGNPPRTYVPIHLKELTDKSFKKFVSYVEAKGLGGLIDATEASGVPISLVSTMHHASKWI